MARRRTARELLLKILFQIDVGKLPPDEVMALAFEEVPTTAEQQQYIRDTTGRVLEHQAELDGIISELAEGWSLQRLANVDKNLLRISLYDLLHSPEVAPGVVVQEAGEMAEKYSTDESPRFVNGILHAFLRRRESAPREG